MSTTSTDRHHHRGAAGLAGGGAVGGTHPVTPEAEAGRRAAGLDAHRARLAGAGLAADHEDQADGHDRAAR